MAIMRHYEGGTEVRQKADKSMVTGADEAAEAIILAALGVFTPDLPVVAEERVAKSGAPTAVGHRFWLVDPLDGTREFLDRNGDFTVNIALVEAGRPILGVVHAPAVGQTYWTSAPGVVMATQAAGAPARVSCRRSPPAGLVVVSSRSHRSPETDTFLARFKVASDTPAGSSLKFCVVARGAADLYPRLGRTMEWDTAAGHAVLAAAGGTVATLDGNELTYGKPGFENPHFVARGRED
ncbi:MAG: 3'(2'),5'-bisphosphate nucleotidase [Alphaproteobacteria bacterium]|nr:3'(2'),5'-bisphosphate nucleotidase [Alphaproteobacteria bacterium]